MIPKSVSGSKTIELIITDPIEGFHLVRENKGNSIYMSDLSKLQDKQGKSDPFGKI